MINTKRQFREITYNGVPLDLIGSGGSSILGTKKITADGTYDAVNDGLDGYSSVTVKVPPRDAVFGELSVDTNGTYTPPDDIDGYNSVIVDVPLTDLTVTQNGTYTPADGKGGFDRVSVQVKEPTETINITENGTYDVLNYASATVDVPPYQSFGLWDDATIKAMITGSEDTMTLQWPSGITNIRNYAFFMCDGLKTLELPEGVTMIQQHSFASCTNLTTVTLPRSLKAIAYRGFYGCWNLKTVTFKGVPTSGIDDDAFAACNDLRTINVPWSEGAGPSGAPWGASGATINYNYTA